MTTYALDEGGKRRWGTEVMAFGGTDGIWGKIGDLGQVKVGQVVDQVCDVGGAGSMVSFPLNYYNGSTDSKDVSRFLNPYNCAVLNTIIP